MDATTCVTTTAFDSSTLVIYFLSVCLLVGVVTVLRHCGKGVLWVLRSIYRFLAMVRRFVCGKGKPADVARPALAAMTSTATSIKPTAAAVPAEAPRAEDMQMRADPRPDMSHNHYEDEEEHAGATDDDSHGAMEAEAEEKEDEDEDEDEEEEVQHRGETGTSNFPEKLKDSEEHSTCCRLYGLLIDQLHKYGRANHSKLVLSLPRGLKWQAFEHILARLLQEEGLGKIYTTQMSTYYHLYLAFDREEGKFMPTIRRARGLLS